MYKQTEATAGWWAMLLPTFGVVLFNLLSRALDGPTAGGLTFLAAGLLAYYFFPKVRLRLPRLALAALLAAAVAVLLGVLL
jgi:FtsH-binding integral membrane protein